MGLAIENDLDSNGNISVINGSNVMVAYTVIQDTDKDLDKNDKIQLLRVSDDSVVASVKRGKKKSGTVKLKVKNSEGEQLYVQYARKNSGDQVARTSHPDDPDSLPLVSTAKLSTTDLVIGLNAIQVRPVSVNAAAFQVENHASTCDYSLTSVAYGRFASGSNCDALGSISLPHGAVMSSMSCGVSDFSNTEGHEIEVSMRRVDYSNGGPSTVFATSPSDDSGFQTLSADISNANLATVDNVHYTYVLWANFGFGAVAGSSVRLYGCTVYFEGWPNG